MDFRQRVVKVYFPPPLGRDPADAATVIQCETTCNNSSFFFMVVYLSVAIKNPQDPQTTMNTTNTVPENLQESITTLYY